VKRYAVLDVGTNSVKFHVGERADDGTWTTVTDRAEVTRLGEGLDETGKLGDEAMARTLEAIAGMADEAKADGVAATAAVGTAGLRIASNSADFVTTVKQRTGIEIEVIPGEEEARLAYLAAVSGLGLSGGSRLVFDTGGGSSQFTFGDGDTIAEQFSLNVGAARFTEHFGLDEPVDAFTVVAARDAVGLELGRLAGTPVPDVVVGMGGGITTMAAVKHGLAVYDPEVVQGTVLNVAEIDQQAEHYRNLSADERRQIPGLQPKRAEVILAGACIVHAILDKVGSHHLTVSDRGLRHGLLVERFG
jgi:exopolyphosphatase/guanosine-5'-triphosphate,3'-diphosphate pyrophosphatase